MEELYKQGLAKSIGVSNYTVALLMNLLASAEVKPAANQVELHPYLVQEELVSYCQESGIALVAYCPLGAAGRVEEGKKCLVKEPVILDLAKKYGKTPAQVLLQWNLARNVVVIPKTSSLERLSENFNCTDFRLTKAELAKINELNCGARVIDPLAIDFLYNVPFFK